MHGKNYSIAVKSPLPYSTPLALPTPTTPSMTLRTLEDSPSLSEITTQSFSEAEIQWPRRDGRIDRASPSEPLRPETNS
jgi:hypothetical protein